MVLVALSAPCTLEMDGSRSRFDAMDLLNDFTRQVVVSRRVGFSRIQVLGRTLGFGQTSFLFPPLLWLKIRSMKLPGFWLSLIFLMLSFAKLRYLFFCRSGLPVVTADQFLVFVGHLLPLEPYLDLPRITGRDLQEVVRDKKFTAGEGWMGGRGMRLRRCLYLGFLVWLFFWIWLKLLVSGLRVYWMLKLP